MDVSKTGYMIRMIIANINSYMSEKVAPKGMNGGQFEYFVFIAQNEGINQNQLAEIKNVGKASVTKAVKILESSDFIIRKVDGSDKRNYKLYPSEKGKSYINSMLQQREEMEQLIFDGFSEEDKVQLVTLLTLMFNNTERLAKGEC